MNSAGRLVVAAFVFGGACREAKDDLPGEVPVIEARAFPAARVGAPYAFGVGLVDPDVGPVTWSIAAGALPAGLSLEGTTLRAQVLGVPERAGAAAFTIAARTEAGLEGTRAFTLQVQPSVASLRLRGPSRLGGPVGVALSLPFEAEGGQAPLTWRDASDRAPGLAFGRLEGRTATLSGTPTQTGVYALALTVEDATGMQASLTSTLTVAEVLKVSTAAAVTATQGVAYRHDLVATGGAPPLRWAAAAPLPPGLALDADGRQARISGAPTSTGAFDLSFEVSDAVGQSAQIGLQIEVLAPLALTPAAWPDAVLGDAYAVTLRVEGGRPPFILRPVSGRLPAGIELVAEDPPRLRGIAGEVGRFESTIEVEDAERRRLRASRTIRVLPSGVPLTVSGPAVLTATTCRAAAAVFTARGGAGFGTRWSVVGALPEGLWLAGAGTATAAIAGVPRRPGRTDVTLEVTDSNRERASVTLTLDVQSGLRYSWAVVGGALDPQGRPGALLVDLCRDAPAGVRGWASTQPVAFARSLDGRWLALGLTRTATAAEVRLVDLASTAPVEQVVISASGIAGDPWFVEEQLFFATEVPAANGSTRTQIHAVDLSTGAPGAPRRVFAGLGGQQLGLRAVSAAGGWLGFGATFDDLRVLDVDGGAVTQLPGDASPIGFDATERWLLYVEEDDLQRDLARAWRLGGAGPPVAFAEARVRHSLHLVQEGLQAVLHEDRSPPVPWRRYSFGDQELFDEGTLAGTEVCGAPVPLASRAWAWCPSPGGVRFAALDDAHPVTTVGPGAQGLFGLARDGRALLVETTLDPARGVEHVHFDLGGLPASSATVLRPSPAAGSARDAAFAPGGRRVFVVGRPGRLSAVHDVERAPRATELWRGGVEAFTRDSAWRPDGAGLFVEEVGVVRWLDLTGAPVEGRLLPVAVPAGWRVDASGAANRVSMPR